MSRNRTTSEMGLRYSASTFDSLDFAIADFESSAKSLTSPLGKPIAMILSCGEGNRKNMRKKRGQMRGMPTDLNVGEIKVEAVRLISDLLLRNSKA